MDELLKQILISLQQGQQEIKNDLSSLKADLTEVKETVKHLLK